MKIMTNEVKEIIDRLKDSVINPIADVPVMGGVSEPIDNSQCLEPNECKLLLDYITNLQEEVENLREEDWAWHQVLKMQNKREYRSKFLKDFQKEYGTNVYPDYDEIYKRYDKMKSNREDVLNLLKDNNIDIVKRVGGHWKEDMKDKVISKLRGEEDGKDNS